MQIENSNQATWEVLVTGGKRGFASMDPARQRKIASQGGKAAHRAGAHEWTAEDAREAGRKGGLAISQRRDHMSRIGTIGGKRRGILRNAQLITNYEWMRGHCIFCRTSATQTLVYPAGERHPAHAYSVCANISCVRKARVQLRGVLKKIAQVDLQ